MQIAIILKAPSIDCVVKEENVIFADGAYRFLAQLGNKKVLAVVGDFDSLGRTPKGENIVSLEVEKNFTDGERAVRLAKEYGADEITIYGAYGGKKEHILGNIALLKIAKDLKDNYNATCLGFKAHPEMLDGQNVGYTSVCMTNCLYLEDTILVNLNIRFSPNTTKSEIKQAVKEICTKYGCTSKIKALKMPAYISPNAREIRLMLNAYKEVFGKETRSEFAMGCGYNSAFPNCAIFGPRFAVNHDEEDTCHSADENRRIEDLYKFFDMLCSFICKYYS